MGKRKGKGKKWAASTPPHAPSRPAPKTKSQGEKHVPAGPLPLSDEDHGDSEIDDGESDADGAVGDGGTWPSTAAGGDALDNAQSDDESQGSFSGFCCNINPRCPIAFCPPRADSPELSSQARTELTVCANHASRTQPTT